MNNNKVKNRFKNISHLSMNVLPVALLLNAMPLFAQQNAIEQIIVTGTYNPLTMEQVSSSVSVVDREMLGQLNKTNLADVLQSVPGVLIEQQGGPGGLAVANQITR
jgi:outer membrane cobalamin receptor